MTKPLTPQEKCLEWAKQYAKTEKAEQQHIMQYVGSGNHVAHEIDECPFNNSIESYYLFSVFGCGEMTRVIDLVGLVSYEDFAAMMTKVGLWTAMDMDNSIFVYKYEPKKLQVCFSEKNECFGQTLIVKNVLPCLDGWENSLRGPDVD